MLPILLLICGADPTPAFVVENKCPPAFTVVNKTTGAVPTDLSQPAPAGWEKVSINGGPWHFRRTTAPGVALPQGGTFPGGCGCVASANCGASFCKSRGGTGCPQSCPVKAR